MSDGRFGRDFVFAISTALAGSAVSAGLCGLIHRASPEVASAALLGMLVGTLVSAALVGNRHRLVGALVLLVWPLSVASVALGVGVVGSLGERYTIHAPPLEPLLPDYLRHPSDRWVVPALGRGWNESDALGTIATSLVLLCHVDGAWEWTEEATGARWLVLALRHSGGGIGTQAAARAQLVATLTARVNAGDRARGDVRDFGDGWVDFEGPVDGEVTAATLRWLPYEVGGEARSLAVVALHHPDDSFDPLLAMVHVTSDSWFGPGLPPPDFVAPTEDLATARRIHAARGNGFTNAAPYGEASPSNATFHRIDYESDVGRIPAYLAEPAGPSRGAVLWLHGGSEVGTTIEPGGGPSVLAERGITVLVPALRGELGSPGDHEVMLGELDDVRAALAALSRLADVPPEEVVVVGHSTGATLALLVAELGVDVRAFVCFGPIAETVPERMPGMPDFPYSSREPYEVWVRSPLHFLAGIRSPTYLIEGGRSPNVPDVMLLRSAAPADIPLEVVVEEEGDHLNLVVPYARRLAEAFDHGGPVL